MNKTVGVSLEDLDTPKLWITEDVTCQEACLRCRWATEAASVVRSLHSLGGTCSKKRHGMPVGSSAAEEEVESP